MFDINRSFLFLKSKFAFLKIGVCFRKSVFESRSLLSKIGILPPVFDWNRSCYLKIQAGFFLTIGDSFENRSLFSKIRVCHLCLTEIGVCYLNIMNPSYFCLETWSQFRKSDFFFKIEVQTSVFYWNRSLTKLAEFFLAKESKRLEKNLPFLRILNTRHFVDRT